MFDSVSKTKEYSAYCTNHAPYLVWLYESLTVNDLLGLGSHRPTPSTDMRSQLGLVNPR